MRVVADSITVSGGEIGLMERPTSMATDPRLGCKATHAGSGHQCSELTHLTLTVNIIIFGQTVLVYTTLHSILINIFF